MSRRLTRSNIKERLVYDPVSGSLLRTCHWSNMHGPDMRIGSPDGHGYIKFCVDGVKHGAHQVAWFIMTGEWPTMEIDHINGDPADNRWENLRQVTHQENISNRANLTKSNKCGAVGVCWIKAKSSYKAYHTQFGKQKHIGYYKELQEAVDAREVYMRELAALKGE